MNLGCTITLLSISTNISIASSSLEIPTMLSDFLFWSLSFYILSSLMELFVGTHNLVPQSRKILFLLFFTFLAPLEKDTSPGES